MSWQWPVGSSQTKKLPVAREELTENVQKGAQRSNSLKLEDAVQGVGVLRLAIAFALASLRMTRDWISEVRSQIAEVKTKVRC